MILIAFGLIMLLVAGAVSAQQGGGAFLGVSVEDTDDGVTIRQVVDGSPAAAGLQVDDVITAVNGEAVATAQELAAAIQALIPGETATLSVTRGGEEVEVEVTLGSMPPNARGGQGNGNRGQGGRGSGDAPFMQMIDAIIIYTPNGEWQVRQLTEGAALYEAGLRQGDVVTAFDGEPLDIQQLTALVAANASETVVLTVTRDGAEQEIEVPTAALAQFYAPMRMEGVRPVDPRSLMPGMIFTMPTNGRLGVTFLTLTEAAAAENEVEFVEGALIQAVEEGSAAAEAGIQEGDIVTAVNGEPVDFERTLRDRIIAYEPGDVVTLTVLRDGEEQEIDVTLAELRPQDYGNFHMEIMPPMMMPEFEQTPEPVMPEATAMPGA